MDKRIFLILGLIGMFAMVPLLLTEVRLRLNGASIEAEVTNSEPYVELVTRSIFSPPGRVYYKATYSYKDIAGQIFTFNDLKIDHPVQVGEKVALVVIPTDAHVWNTVENLKRLQIPKWGFFLFFLISTLFGIFGKSRRPT